jgi:hypothetical protein
VKVIHGPNAMLSILLAVEKVKIYMKPLELGVRPDTATGRPIVNRTPGQWKNVVLAFFSLYCTIVFRPIQSTLRPMLTMNDDRPSRPEAK